MWRLTYVEDAQLFSLYCSVFRTSTYQMSNIDGVCVAGLHQQLYIPPRQIWISDILDQDHINVHYVMSQSLHLAGGVGQGRPTANASMPRPRPIPASTRALYHQFVFTRLQPSQEIKYLMYNSWWIINNIWDPGCMIKQAIVYLKYACNFTIVIEQIIE